MFLVSLEPKKVECICRNPTCEYFKHHEEVRSFPAKERLAKPNTSALSAPFGI